MACDCGYFVSLLRDVVGWSAVGVIVAFPCHTYFLLELISLVCFVENLMEGKQLYDTYKSWARNVIE